jgi:hypothetical protein
MFCAFLKIKFKRKKEVMAEVDKAKAKVGVLENVVLAYVKVAEATQKYQSKDLEYVIDCIVDKPTAKTWNKAFPKQKAKELDADEFKTKYKMDNPFDGDEVYVIKLKKAATKDGEVFDEKYRPKVLLDMNDGERVEITTSRLVSNGSKGKVSYRINTNDFGTFAQLQNILIKEDDFIEYKSSGFEPGSEFDGKAVSKVEPENEAATKARAKKAEAEKKPAESAKASKPKQEVKPEPTIDDMDDDDSIPF